MSLHIAPVLAADCIERLGDLAQTADPRGFHQFGENIVAGQRHFLQALQRCRRRLCVAFFKIRQTLEL